MAYGWERRIDALSLAALDDLGHFHVRFDLAECTEYGARAGCAWLEARCSVPATRDRSVLVSSEAECDGSAQWVATYDPYLEQKCFGGNDPCADGAGFDPVAMRCDAQCVTPTASSNGSCMQPNGTTRSYHRDHDHHGNDGLLDDADLLLVMQIFLIILLAWGLGLVLFATLDIGDYRVL